MTFIRSTDPTPNKMPNAWLEDVKNFVDLQKWKKWCFNANMYFVILVIFGAAKKNK